MATLFEEDFQAFLGDGFAPTPAAGQLDSDIWRITGLSDGNGSFGGTHTSGDFARGFDADGGVNTGGVYAFDTGSSNVMLGIQPAGSDFTPGTLTLKLTNTTGTTLTSLDLTYDIFYNNDQTRANSLNFAYSTDDATYTAVNALDFTTPEASDSNGFQSVNRSTTITGLSIADGADFYLQWQGDDVAGSGSRDEIGIDNVVVSSGAAAVTTLANIDFQSFTGSGFAPNPTASQLDSDAWRITGLSDGNGSFGGTHTTGDFARGLDDNGATTGGAYAFGTGSGNIILGIQPAGSDFTPGEITLKLTNTTGSVITDLDIAYDIFYSNDQARSNSLNFAYSTDDVTYTAVNALDFTTPQAADANGFQSVNRSTTLSGLNIAVGADFFLQWQGGDVGGSGSRDEYGIDNIVVTTGSGGGGGTTLAIADVSQAEGDSGTTTLTFTVTRSGDTSGATSVDFATLDGTAIAGADYTASSGTLNFMANETTQTLTVDIIGDTDVESDETFSVVLFNALGGATITDDTATGTIQNDDIGLTLISAIQGTTDMNLMDDQVVTIEAIVVGDFQDGDADTGRDLRGFYVQEEDADADGNALTSEGIFVFENGNFITDVNIGDRVQITGTVDEFFGETQIGMVTNITVISSGNTLPTAATLTLPTAGTTTNQDGDLQPDLEAFEGMLVNFSDTLTITEMFQLDRFNEIKLSQGGRLEQFTQSNIPGVAGYAAHLQDIGSRTITYDDGVNVQNTDLGIGNLDGFGPTFSTATDIRMGDTIDSLSGVLSYQWAGNSASGATWRVRSTVDGENSFDKVNTRPATPNPVGGDFKVASFNVLNFFTTLDEFPSVGEGSGPNGLSPRGADANPQDASPTPGATDEYNRQLAKLVQSLVAADADVVGLVELENDFQTGGAAPTGSGTVVGSGVAIQELVDALNTELGSGTYDWVRPATGEFVGGDAIAVGFIYDTATVNLVGNSAVLDTSAFLDPNNTGSNRNRAALAQTFQQVASGEAFTATINHFKSKGDSGLAGGPLSNPDVDQLDGQGFWNDTRTKAAQELVNWLNSDPTGSGDSDFLILGDLNAYASEDPITTLEGLGYTDLAEQFISNPRSFVFDGQTGTLDYALANSTLASQVTGATEWHINADEADALDYNLEFGRDPTIFDGTVPFRASDHDPVIIGLDLGDPTIGGFTLAEENLVTNASITSGAAETSFFGSGLLLTALVDNTVGALLGSSAGDSIDLGDNLNRSEIELAWDIGNSLSNQTGDDFVVYENGNVGEPEAYAVSVRNAATGLFTNFRYEFFDSFDDPAINGSGAGVFATAFDLSDFGLAPGDLIDAIRIVNLVATDTVDGSDGQGGVDFTGTTGFTPLDGAGGQVFDASKFDADITLVGGLHDLTLPPPLTLVVDTLTDELDGSVVDGDVSLRDALAAIAEGGTITFSNTLAGQIITLNGTALNITKAVTIDGETNNITISGNNTTRLFKIDDSDAGNTIAVSLSGLTFTQGFANNGSSDGDGGAIWNVESLTLSNSIVTGNTAADDGGGIRNDGTLTLDNSQITHNTSTGTSTTSGGGGIINTTSGTLTISDSTFSGNSALNGGGIRNDGALVISNSTLNNNQANGTDGGGALVNTFNISGGALATAQVINTTISGNTATSTGGGISVRGGTVTVRNSTIVSNTATTTGGGISGIGTANLSNSIVAGNTSATAPDASTATIELIPGILSLVGTINGNGNNLVGDVSGVANGTLGTGTDLTLAGLGVMLSDVLATSLADNGGVTQTHALVANSPALDAGDNALALDNLGVPLTTDQRGVNRVRNGIVDIGSFEVQNDAPTDITLDNTSIAENSSNGTLVGTLSATDADAGDIFTFNLLDDAAGRFQIVGNQLQVGNGTLIDFETNSSHDVIVQVTDSRSATFEKTVAIALTDANDVPTAIGLSNDTVLENTATGTTIGTFSSTDQDTADTFTYSLVAGTGDTDNASFEIVSGQLQTNTAIDFETQASYSIRVQTDDGNGGTFAQTFTINVTDVNETTPVGGDGTITGTTNDDFLFGMNNDDTIDGLAGNDILIGQGGNDLLIGGPGTDILLGQAGKDFYQYNALDESVLGAIDTIVDFDQTAEDRFDINAVTINNAFYAGDLSAQTSLSDAANAAASNFVTNEAVFFQYVGRVHLMVDGGNNTYESANDLMVQVSQFTFKSGDGTASGALAVEDYFA